MEKDPVNEVDKIVGHFLSLSGVQSKPVELFSVACIAIGLMVLTLRNPIEPAQNKKSLYLGYGAVH